MDNILNSENVRINTRYPAAARWASRDLTDREQRRADVLGAASAPGGAAPGNPAWSRRAAGGRHPRVPLGGEGRDDVPAVGTA